jgi:cytochrome c biogenesis protein CcmG, thiol:disulfide interchange protein DsbE
VNNPPSTPKKSSPGPFVAAGILIGLFAGLALMLIFGPGRTILDRLNRQKAKPAVPALNAPAPDFELQTLDGQSMQLSALDGKIRLLNFWATWCEPCRQEMPLLQEYQVRYSDQVAILAINNAESDEKVAAFVDKFNLHLPVLLDPGTKTAELYQVSGFPTTIFIDPQGIIRYRHIGVLNRDTLEGYLADLGATK